MNVTTRKRYSAEFKAQALELVDMGKPVPQVARELEIGSDLIYRWRRDQAQSVQGGSSGEGAVGDRAAADELRALRREVADLKVENDILKKAAVILGTKPQSKPGK